MFHERADVLRRRAAAAAEEPCAAPDAFLHALCELLRPDIEHGPAVCFAREPRVGLKEDGDACAPGKFFKKREHFTRAEAAVEAERIHAEPFKQRGHAWNVAAGEQLSAPVQRNGGEDGERAAFLCGKYGRLELISVGHGLDQHKVCACGSTGFDGRAEHGIGLFKAEVAKRLEQLARWPDIERHETLFAACLADGFLCVAHGGSSNLCGGIARARELMLRAAEGVGGDDVASDRKVSRMHGGHRIRVRNVPHIRGFACRKAGVLEHRAHCAVKEQYLLLKQLLKFHFEDSFRYSQARFPHAAHLCSGQGCASAERPITAVMDLRGVSICEDVSARPSRRSACRARSMSD